MLPIVMSLIVPLTSPVPHAVLARLPAHSDEVDLQFGSERGVVNIHGLGVVAGGDLVVFGLWRNGHLEIADDLNAPTEQMVWADLDLDGKFDKEKVVAYHIGTDDVPHVNGLSEGDAVVVLILDENLARRKTLQFTFTSPLLAK